MRFLETFFTILFGNKILESSKNAKDPILAIFTTPLISHTGFLWFFLTKLEIGQNYLIFKRIFGPARLQVRKRVAQYPKFFFGLYQVSSTPKNFYSTVRSVVFEIFDFKVQKHPKKRLFYPFGKYKDFPYKLSFKRVKIGVFWGVFEL